MSQRTRGCAWRGPLAAAAVCAGALLLVPAALADIVGSPAGSGTKNAGLGGFKSGEGWTTNKNNVGNPPTFSGASVQITDDVSNEHNTVFYLSPQVVTGAWIASFTYQVSGTRLADGAAFVIHNDPAGANAGTPQNGGSALGYLGIDNSVAVAFNVYSQSNSLHQGTGHVGETDLLFQSLTLGSSNTTDLGSNHTYPNDPTVTGTPPFDITSGDPIQVTLTYDPIAAVLTQTLLDTATGGTDSYTYNVDISLIVGADSRNLVTAVPGTAFVGFTGGTGGSHAIQTFSNFTFIENP
ncbi:MAG TPA: hypothetical protein VKU02_12380 [Gemmataceae bacterium]|nr:hypothetical protein [Gemmataceae bacterium]